MTRVITLLFLYHHYDHVYLLIYNQNIMERIHRKLYLINARCDSEDKNMTREDSITKIVMTQTQPMTGIWLKLIKVSLSQASLSNTMIHQAK